MLGEGDGLPGKHEQPSQLHGEKTQIALITLHGGELAQAKLFPHGQVPDYTADVCARCLQRKWVRGAGLLGCSPGFHHDGLRWCWGGGNYLWL